MSLKHLGFFAALGQSVNVKSSDEDFKSFRRGEPSPQSELSVIAMRVWISLV